MPDHALAPTKTSLSTYPLIGIVAVVLGGSLSTLNGRLLTVALPDLRGALHLSVDEAAWIPAAYNMTLMFIGVFSVYLGALLGARRVLLSSCFGYALASVSLPFAGSYKALLVLQVLAGLTSGTFYPLTLSFILTSLPIRVAHWGVGAYAIAILFSANIASSLDSLYMDTLSWRWTFFNGALLAPLMATCVYFGIPGQPLPPKRQAGPSWRGLLYWSFGLAFIFGALDQGERLHWFDSPTYAAMLGTGVFLLLISIARRFEDPNPLIALPFLRNFSTILLAVILFSFRLFLLATALFIPQFLASVEGLRDQQIGPLLSIVALLQFAIGCLVAFALPGVNTRLLMASGFAVIGLSAFLCSRLNAAWHPATFIPFAVLFAIGESCALVGMVGSIVLQTINTGAVSSTGKLQRPVDVITFSGFFHTVRLMGGEVGTVLMVHLLSQRTKFHASILGQNVQTSHAMVRSHLSAAFAFFHPIATSATKAAGWTGSLLGLELKRQAASMAYADAFTTLAWSCLVVLVVIACIRLRISRLQDLS